MSVRIFCSEWTWLPVSSCVASAKSRERKTIDAIPTESLKMGLRNRWVTQSYVSVADVPHDQFQCSHLWDPGKCNSTPSRQQDLLVSDLVQDLGFCSRGDRWPRIETHRELEPKIEPVRFCSRRILFALTARLASSVFVGDNTNVASRNSSMLAKTWLHCDHEWSQIDSSSLDSSSLSSFSFGTGAVPFLLQTWLSNYGYLSTAQNDTYRNGWNDVETPFLCRRAPGRSCSPRWF